MTLFLAETAFIFLKQEFLYRAFEEKMNEEKALFSSEKL